MAAEFRLCTAILHVMQLSLVLGRHDYYYYFSRYHKGSSTPEPTISSTSEISPSDDVIFNKIEGTSNGDGQAVLQFEGADDKEEKSNIDDQGLLQHGDVFVEKSSNPRFKDKIMATSTIVAIVMGVVISAIALVCCIGLCCLCCRGCCGNSSERKGFVFGSHVPVGQEPVVGEQHFPPDHLPQYPPPYDTQPVHQQQHFQYQSVQEPFQHPPVPQDHHYPPTQQPPVNVGYQNQPSAPPPYFDKY